MTDDYNVSGGPFEVLGPEGQRFAVDVAAVQLDDSGALFIAAGSPLPEPETSCLLTLEGGINPRVITIRIGMVSVGDPGAIVMFGPA